MGADFAAIKQEALAGESDQFLWSGRVHASNTDGGSQPDAVQSVAAALLRTASGRQQTQRDGDHRGNANAANRSLEVAAYWKPVVQQLPAMALPLIANSCLTGPTVCSVATSVVLPRGLLL
jgi:hypothetical protein